MPAITAACASDVATLLPSPTYAMVRPASLPSRSCSVSRSATAWHGCSSSVSALTTCRPGAAVANSSRTCCANVRMTTASTQRSRLRATSAADSRPPSATSEGIRIGSPPSSRTATSKVTRVRSDGLSKSSATCRPDSGVSTRRRPAARACLSRAASARQAASSSGVTSASDRNERVRGGCGWPARVGRAALSGCTRAAVLAEVGRLMFGTPR